MLTSRKNLAKTSGKPGKTQLINHFKINDNWFLVDLPGYGYAQISKSKRRSFQVFITEYFLRRPQLVCSFVLIDVRHEPQKIDVEFMRFLGENEIPFCIVFTKADKLTSHILKKNVENYKTELLKTWEEMPPYFVTSATNKNGREELLEFIDGVNKNLQ